MRTSSLKAAIDGVADIIIETITEEIFLTNDIPNNMEPHVKNVVMKQYEEMKSRIINEIKNNKNNKRNNKNVPETVVIKRRIVEINHNEDIT